jgi:hypothetical protein
VLGKQKKENFPCAAGLHAAQRSDPVASSTEEVSTTPFVFWDYIIHMGVVHNLH